VYNMYLAMHGSLRQPDLVPATSATPTRRRDKAILLFANASDASAFKKAWNSAPHADRYRNVAASNARWHY
jgi:hypothetical protein